MDQEDNHNALASVPIKRKRGRPRKYPVLDTVDNTPPQMGSNLSSRKNANLQGNHNVSHGENASVPPGFKTPNINQPIQENHVQGSNDVMVGQVVSGVVEAVFDAGCLLSVRVGNPQTTLRGVVFRPGSYVPLSAENDVAPNVQMIRRKEIHLPTVNSAQVQSHSSQAKEKNSQLDSLLNSGTAQPPSKLSSDGAPKVTNPDANAAISRNEQMPSLTQIAPHLLSAGGNMFPLVTQPSQVLSQTDHPTTSGYQVASLLHHSTASASTTIQPNAHPADYMSVDKLGAQESGDTHENEAKAPLQAVEAIHQNYSAAVPISMSSQVKRSDKMSELLRVLQENLDDSKKLEAQERHTRCSSKSDERDPEAQFGANQSENMQS